jgi:hypothetical protein
MANAENSLNVGIRHLSFDIDMQAVLFQQPADLIWIPFRAFMGPSLGIAASIT